MNSGVRKGGPFGQGEQPGLVPSAWAVVTEGTRLLEKAGMSLLRSCCSD
jgi:hypothetical protein